MDCITHELQRRSDDIHSEYQENVNDHLSKCKDHIQHGRFYEENHLLQALFLLVQSAVLYNPIIS